MRADRWQKAAERADARAERDAGPLFAAFAPKTTADAAQVRAESMVARQDAALAESQRRQADVGAAAREAVSWVVAPEELDRLDHARSASPPSAEYGADFWTRECRRRGLPWPGRDAYLALWDEVDRLATRRPPQAPSAEQVPLTFADPR